MVDGRAGRDLNLNRAPELQIRPGTEMAQPGDCERAHSRRRAEKSGKKWSAQFIIISRLAGAGGAQLSPHANLDQFGGAGQTEVAQTVRPGCAIIELHRRRPPRHHLSLAGRGGRR